MQQVSYTRFERWLYEQISSDYKWILGCEPQNHTSMIQMPQFVLNARRSYGGRIQLTAHIGVKPEEVHKAKHIAARLWEKVAEILGNKGFQITPYGDVVRWRTGHDEVLAPFIQLISHQMAEPLSKDQSTTPQLIC